MIEKGLKEIPDFTVIPSYAPKQFYGAKEKKFELYNSSFESMKNKYFVYKATCKLKFDCINCLQRGEKSTWTTSLGVCDINYKLDIRKKQKTNKDLTKEERTKIR